MIMKNLLTMCVFVIVIFTLALGSGIAGNGNSDTCDCTVTDDVTGFVTAICDPGGVTLSEEGTNEDYTIYGLGPSWFWDIDKPAVGEKITVVYYICTDRQLKIATEIIINGVPVYLRDLGTCLPLWRQ
jgi:hypothetical protein